METGGDVLELRLPALPTSVNEARRAVKRLLTSRGASPELVDNAVLLVSEVVTNAVLHAGTELVVAAKASANGARVGVTDFSPVVPSARHHGEEASTGRGMLLVEAMSSRCGTKVKDGMKTVWFTVGDAAGPDVAEVDQADNRTGVLIRFLNLHVAMARATLTYGEAVVRELTLMNTQGEIDERPWAVPKFSLGPLWAHLDDASAARREIVDLEVEFPRGEIEHCLERLALVEEADRLAREGKLLTVAAVPEVAYYRRWIYRQIHGQANGADAEPWITPAHLPPVVDPVVLDAADIVRLGQGQNAVVLADDGNRILYANETAERLLGWHGKA